MTPASVEVEMRRLRAALRMTVVIATLVFAAGSLVGQETAEDIRRRRERDERNIDRICAGARAEYEAQNALYEKLKKGSRDPKWLEENNRTREEAERAVRDSWRIREEARSSYCECLRNNYAKAGHLMPAEYERLCGKQEESAPPGAPGLPPQPPAPAADEECSQARKRYLDAREAWIKAGRPFLGFEAAVMAKEIEKAAEEYCECLRRRYAGAIPPEVEQFCRRFGPSAAIDPPPLGTGPEAFDPPLPPKETPPGVGGPIRRDRLRRPAAPPDKGAGNTGSTPEPPPPPVAPPAPGAGTGSGGGGAGTGTGGAPVPPEPRAPAPPAPTEVSRVLSPGTTANVAFSNVVHAPGSPDPHVASAATGGVAWCRLFVATQLLSFLQVTETSFSMRFANQPGNLDCPGPPNGPVDCVGRFSGLSGQAGETVVRASGVTFGNGRVQGRLEVNSAASPFSATFSGALVTP